jgi:DNA-binding NtrC family response regulator
MKLARCGPELPINDRVLRMVKHVGERVIHLKTTGAADVRRYAGADREIVRAALLFDVYHRYLSAMDQLILDQVAAGERSLPVTFADDVLGEFVQRGFPAPEATRLLAIFFQLRRAYYFIDRRLIGASPCMKELRRRLWSNVFTDDVRWYEQRLWNRMEDFSTMLLGDTGTGKGTAAAAIGRSGFIPYDERGGCFAESFVRTFVSLNLSQFPETLIESELFGHKKGSFTGAISDHAGALARCSQHGAIFLDEIGDATVPVQIKLLQVLQERVFSPVGSHDRVRFAGRVIAATNKPLDDLRATGQFRSDFYYRLCSDVIAVPPLRQRIAEEPRELDELLAGIVERLLGTPDPDLAGKVRERLLTDVGRDYAWPGNVRELEQATRRVLLTQHYTGDQKAVAPDLRSRLLAGVDAGSLDADALLAGYCALLYERHGTIEEVARRTNLDRRTVKAYLEKQKPSTI